MDPKTVDSLIDFAAAASVVTGVAAALGAVAYLVARGCGQPLRARWQPPGVPWPSAALLLCLFPIGLLGYQLSLGAVIGWGGAGDDGTEAAKQLRQIRAAAVTAPIFLMAYLAVRRVVLTGTPAARWPSFEETARNVALGVFGWCVLMPLTFAVHFLVLRLSAALGVGEQLHPLMSLRPQDDGTGGILFGFAICVCTPVVEECLFRGLLVPWAGQRRFAPWVLMAAALLLAAMTATTPGYPVGFVVFVSVLLGVLHVAPRKRFPRRTLAAVLSSSAVFAAAHSAVWPTPVPLFVLACGLGYLTAHARSIVPAVVVHGLFNAVSFVMICRGSAI